MTVAQWFRVDGTTVQQRGPRYRALLSARAEAEVQRDTDEVSLNESERRRLHDARVPVDAGQVQLDEALHIMGDEIELLRAGGSQGV